MKQILEPLTTSALTNMEAGQLFRRHLGDLGTIDASLLVDAPFNNYVQLIGNQAVVYENALAQVRKNEETQKIVDADALRDKAVTSFNLALKLHATSDDPAEVEASRSLGILFSTYKNLAKLNYEAESLAIDKLTGELNSPAYSEKINYLHMSKYVARLIETNTAFKNIFSGRMVGNAMTESFDLKTIRIELQSTYSDFCDYILSMAKALNTPLFVNALNLLNTARKYYADLLARRTAPKTEKTNPQNN
jgi:hypothetical protein